MPNDDESITSTYVYTIDPDFDTMEDSTSTSNSSNSSTAINGTKTLSNTLTASTNNLYLNSSIINSGYLSSYFDEDYLQKISSPLAKLINKFATEQELDTILDLIRSRVSSPTDDIFQSAIIEVISNRHCSEEFILKYLDLSKYTGLRLREILEKHHAVEINTGLYSGLAVYLTLGD